jgi:hypothetical protein
MTGGEGRRKSPWSEGRSVDVGREKRRNLVQTRGDKRKEAATNERIILR